jgi:hypothetical protein
VRLLEVFDATDIALCIHSLFDSSASIASASRSCLEFIGVIAAVVPSIITAIASEYMSVDVKDLLLSCFIAG